MTNAVFETIDDFDDIASVNYYAYEVAAGADPVELLEQMRPASRDNARSPMPGIRLRRQASRPVSRGSGSTRITRRSTRRSMASMPVIAAGSSLNQTVQDGQRLSCSSATTTRRPPGCHSPFARGNAESTDVTPKLDALDVAGSLCPTAQAAIW